MKSLLIIVGLLLLPTMAWADNGVTATVVSSCGTPPATYNAGQSYPMTMDTTGTLCTGTGGGSSTAVTAFPDNITPHACSIALTSGTTAQNIITGAATIHGFTIANIDASAGGGEPVWISFTTTAAASGTDSYPLAAPTATTFATLSSYTTPPGFGSNASVSVVATTTGHKISCTYW